jgi:hypothetical protein
MSLSGVSDLLSIRVRVRVRVRVKHHPLHQELALWPPPLSLEPQTHGTFHKHKIVATATPAPVGPSLGEYTQREVPVGVDL